jgi:hypothetical protein
MKAAKVIQIRDEPQKNEGATGLTHYDAFRRELALCATTDEVKNIRDRARAAELYAKQIHDETAQRELAAIRIRAERRLGELLKEMAERGERHSGASKIAGPGRGKAIDDVHGFSLPTLSDLGISPDESSRCQRLADIPEEEFEKAITDPNVIPTTQGVLNRASFTVQTTKKRIEYDLSEYVQPTKKVFDYGMPLADGGELLKVKPPVKRREKKHEPVVLEGQTSGEAEEVARKLLDNLEAINEMLAFTLPQRKAALESSYGPILYTTISWIEQSAHTFIAGTKPPSKQAIRKARTAHPQYGSDQ